MHFNQSNWRVSKDHVVGKYAVLTVPLKKNRSYYCSGNSKETIGYYIKFGTTIVRLPVQDQYMASLKLSDSCEERREAVNELIIWAINRFKL